MSSLTKAIERSDGLSEMTKLSYSQMKAGDVGGQLTGTDDGSGLNMFQNQSKYAYRYNLYRGWLFSAINALASQAASQCVNVGLIKEDEDELEKQGSWDSHKQFTLSKMTKGAYGLASKANVLDVEVLRNSTISATLENPNRIQSRWQFVYMFVANLALTGWSYIILDYNESGDLEMFAVPTTWVNPLPGDDGAPFGKFKVKNPKKAGIEGVDYSKDQIAFAYFPNPSDPLAALSPAAAQLEAVKIDDKILSTQNSFFDNGIFPSAIVKVGTNPHPEVAAGVRPRLTAAQRRQVHNIINRTMRGVTRYGNPVIVDGYIESVSRFSATQQEMGWEKSEGKIRTRILSAYSVHPYILGEPVGVGGYAQVAGIERVFCGKVNTFLDMLGNVMTNHLRILEKNPNLLVWWDKTEPLDPSIKVSLLKEGRKNGDITRDEFRAELGLPPMEKKSNRSRLVGDPVAFSSLINALGKQRQLDKQTLGQLLVLFLGITEEEAAKITASGTTDPTELLEEVRNVVSIIREPVKMEVNHIEVGHEADRVLEGV